MHRRRFLHAAAIGGIAGPKALNHTRARQPATPAEDIEATLASRVASVDPEVLLDALLTTPIATALLPADTPAVEPVAWDDDSDSDLANAVGGVVFNTGYDANDNYLAVGNAIVHPDAASASAALGIEPADMDTFLELPWFVQAESNYAVSVVRIDYLLLVGGADAPRDDVIVNDGEAGITASPAPETEPAHLVLRAISHMTALLDHLDSVLGDLEG